jgi:hypothetical protein
MDCQLLQRKYLQWFIAMFAPLKRPQVLPEVMSSVPGTRPSVPIEPQMLCF